MALRRLGDHWISAGYFGEDEYDPDFKLKESVARKAQENKRKEEQNG